MHDAFADASLVGEAVFAGVEREIIVDGKGVEESAGLEDEGEADLGAGAGVGGVEGVDADFAAGGGFQTGDVF